MLEFIAGVIVGAVGISVLAALPVSRRPPAEPHGQYRRSYDPDLIGGCPPTPASPGDRAGAGSYPKPTQGRPR
jgi:hypothetical protein